MGKRGLDIILLPVAVFVVGWGFWTLLSLATETERNISVPFLLWLASLPFLSGWMTGRYCPWPVWKRGVRVAAVWAALLLLLGWIAPVYCPVWLVFLAQIAAALLGVAGVYLGAGFTVAKQQFIPRAENEE